MSAVGNLDELEMLDQNKLKMMLHRIAIMYALYFTTLGIHIVVITTLCT